MSIEHKHKGAHAELIACSWLLENGYDVFRNVSQHGKIDLIGMKDGSVTFFDVKTNNRNKQGYRNYINVKPPTGVSFLLVDEIGNCEIWNGPL